MVHTCQKQKYQELAVREVAANMRILWPFCSYSWYKNLSKTEKHISFT